MMMLKLRLIHLLCFLGAEVANALPSTEELAGILGYPSSEVVVADVTTEERRVLESPSARERRSLNPPMLSANQLVAAYKITARDPETFYPIIVSVAKEGAFLTAEVQKTLTDISASPDRPISKGGRGPLGDLKLEGIREGGIYIGKVKRPSRDAAMLEPQERMAMVSVMRLESEHLEVRIAFMVALEKGTDLKPIEGGQSYFHSFGASAEELDGHSVALRDRIARFSSLVLADVNSPTFGTHTRTNSEGGGGSPATASGKELPATAPFQTARWSGWIWIVFGVVALFPTLFTLRKKRQ